MSYYLFHVNSMRLHALGWAQLKYINMYIGQYTNQYKTSTSQCINQYG